MPATQNFVRGKALVLGGLVGGAVLCACLSLIGFVFLLAALVRTDDRRVGGPDWGYPVAFVSVAPALFAAFRCGRRVGRDWYYNGR